MAQIASIKKPESNFEPLSAGYHNGVLSAVEVRDFDGNNFNTGVPETVTKLLVTFLSETDPDIDGEPAQGRLFLKLAYGPRAHLTIVRERLLGRPLTPEETIAVDDEEFIGKRIRVQCKHRTSKTGQLYGNLDPTSVVLLDDETATPPAIREEDSEDDVPF